ncbi:MAG: tetratricopeptide repeat protein, partial [Fimbriimonadaceae bacterium]|nr:tetratricopeptide repeat protein [Chitinophagales bacterium]
MGLILLLTFVFCFGNIYAQPAAPNKLDKENRRHGEWIFYIDTNDQYISSPDTAGTYRLAKYDHGKLQGKVPQYDYKDRLLYESEFSSLNPDTLNGLYISYFYSGKKHEEFEYVNDVVNGKTITYYENGNVYIDVAFKNGKHNGLYKEYYDNGKLHRTGSMTEGKKDGNFIFYAQDGKIEEERMYVNDMLDGEKKVYKDGRLNYGMPYDNGKLNGVGQFYNPDGTINDYFIYYEGNETDITKLIEKTADLISSMDVEAGLTLGMIIEEYFRKKYGTDNELYEFAVSTLATFYFMSGDQDSAVTWIKKNADIYIKKIDTEKEPGADKWHMMSLMCEAYNLTDEAIIANLRTIARSYKNGKPTEETLEYMNRLAHFYYVQYRDMEANKVYDDLLALIESDKKEFSDTYVYYGLEYADELYDHNEINNALSLLNKIEPYAKTSEKNSITYKKANIYSDQNNIDKATILYSQLFESFGKTQPDTLLHILIMEKLAYHNSDIANYAAAEKLYIDMLALTEKYDQSKDAFYYNYVNDLADFYDRVGRYSKSLSLRNEMVQYYKSQIENPSTLDFLLDTVLLKSLYLSTLLDNAETNRLAGNNEITGNILRDVVSQSKSLSGDTTMTYMRSIAALAGWQLDNYQYESSESNYKSVIDISEKYFAETDVNYDTWKDNLSELYFRTKNYDAALKLAEEVYEVRKKTYKENDPMLLASYGRLSEIYEAKGDIEKAYAYLKKDMDARVAKIQSDFSIMNQNEKEQYLSTFRYRFDEFNFFAFQHVATIPAIAQDVMNYQLANKSMLLYSVSAARTT